MTIINKLSSWYFRRSAFPHWGVLLLDCIIVMFAVYLAAYLHFGGIMFAQHFWPVTYGMLVTVIIYVICFRLFHTYVGIIRYSSFVDLRHIATATAAASVITMLISLLTQRIDQIILPTPRHCLTLFVVSTLLMWFVRIAVKTLYDEFRITPTTRKAFVYGVQAGGVALAKSIQNTESARYSLVGFVSPDGENATKYLMGVKIRRDGPNLIKHIQESGATALIVSPIQHNHFLERQDLIDALINAHIQILMMNAPEEWDGKSELPRTKFREVGVEELLPRNPIEVDMNAIAEQLTGKSILITGAAGSIGSEIVRQVASFRPSHLVLVDSAETPMHDIRLMMASKYPDVKAETIVATITDRGYMEHLFARYTPEYVFHAAAYKHVPMMEDNPAIAIQNNVRGTRIIADLAVKYNTKKFVMISTDKAVNPTNVMGCSKRICEIYCQSLNRAIQNGTVPGITQFVTTRFGNVLGSNGSVIPLFRKQIQQGGPLTVTDPNIIRYFMLIPEACKLVLEAATIGKGGEIFVFDMGKPVKIADLAKRMIALSGANDIEIKYTGLRDGEKLFEEILSDKEHTKPTPNSKIFIADVREYEYSQACGYEDALFEMSYSASNKEIVQKMMEIVPEYRSTNEDYL